MNQDAANADAHLFNTQLSEPFTVEFCRSRSFEGHKHGDTHSSCCPSSLVNPVKS
jgi:hypothetical protein